MIETILLSASLAFGADGTWLKTYPVRQFAAYWHCDYRVQELAKNKEKILNVLKKNGGVLTQPLESFPSTKDGRYQQLSYRISRKDAERALKELNKSGTRTRSSQKDDGGAYIEEASEKLIRLKNDLENEKEALKRMPAVAELAAAYRSHLEDVVRSYEDSKEAVLLNLVLEEK